MLFLLLLDRLTSVSALQAHCTIVKEHELERRKDGVENMKNSFSVRVELTFASCSWDFLDKAIQSLRVQDKQPGMLPAEFERQFYENPEERPWFKNVLSHEHIRRRMNVRLLLTVH